MKNVILLEDLLNIGTDVTLMAPEFWHPNLPLQEVNVQLLEIVTLSQVKQSFRWLACIGPKNKEENLCHMSLI